jgi:hypothetical protein
MVRMMRSLLLGLVGAAWLGLGLAHAETLPKGDEVMDQSVEAIGGKKLLGKFKNRVSQGTIDLTAGGIKCDITVSEAAPNKMLVEFTLGNLGKFQEGSDGETAWSESAIGGASIKTGDEKANALREALFNGELEWRKIYKTAECVGTEDVDGKPCYKVKLTTMTGQERTVDYNQKTHLAVKAVSTQKTPMGEMTVETVLGDYKRVDGMVLPHVMKQKVGPQEFTIVFTKIQHNVDIPADRFALPDEIQKLKKKEDEGKK